MFVSLLGSVVRSFALAGMVGVALFSNANAATLKEHRLGKADAPVVVDEYVSLTCSHCAEFYTDVLPELEKKYVETGKVAFVLHHFPLDGISLKGAALAECLPDEQYFPFIRTLFAGQKTWAFGKGDPETTLIQYSRLAGLTTEKAKACMNDTEVQNAILARRQEATDKVHIEATPTFVVNKGVEVIRGAQKAPAFAVVFDRLLAAKK